MLRVAYGGKAVTVRVNDRGPYVRGRDLELSQAAAAALGCPASARSPCRSCPGTSRAPSPRAGRRGPRRRPASGARSGGAHDAGLVPQRRRHAPAAARVSSGRNFSRALRDAAAQDDQVRPDQLVDAVEVLVEQRRPLRVGQARCAPGRPPTRAARRPCPGSRCGRAPGSAPGRRRRTAPTPIPVPSVSTRTDALHAPPRAEAHLGHAGGVGVVEDHARAARSRRVNSSGRGLRPPSDVSRLAIISTRPPTIGPGTPMPTGPCVRAERRHDLGRRRDHRLGRRRLRRRHPHPLADQRRRGGSPPPPP